MYQPSHFAENDPQALHALIRTAPLATLVVPTAAGLQANPLPLLLRETPDGLVLAGHVARANPVWTLAPTGEALAVFAGVQGYVSPNWYPSKAVHGQAVPTWNYAVVHAHGTLHWVDDTTWLRRFLTELTAVHEAAAHEAAAHEAAAHEAGQAPPWRLDDAPADFIERLLRAIVGLELRVTRLEGKFKLSQNRSDADRRGVIEGLERQSDATALALAAAMRTAGGA
jgi:transcriptional regulator